MKILYPRLEALRHKAVGSLYCAPRRCCPGVVQSVSVIFSTVFFVKQDLLATALRWRGFVVGALHQGGRRIGINSVKRSIQIIWLPKPCHEVFGCTYEKLTLLEPTKALPRLNLTWRMLTVGPNIINSFILNQNWAWNGNGKIMSCRGSRPVG